jgi:esterase/lipase superfamily enzyme
MKTIPHFMEFVESIRSEAGVTTVNVLAHSMGNRIVVESMENFAQSGVSAPLHHVLLAAPDIDAELFKRAIVPALASSASTTMYVSDADKALQASSEVHGSPRAGSQIILISGMETIDASGVDSDVLGHSYYGAATLIQDVFYLLHEGFGANERGLELRMNADGDYWALPR